MKAIIYIVILIILSTNFANSSNNIRIPVIGDTSSRYMSISQENRLGEIIYSQILGSFDLISDPDEKICKQYDVIKEKSMYGKKYMGIERSTFLINSKGKLVKEWRKVKVKGHAEEVLESAKEI